jgi:hypothetical protein
VYNCKKIPEVMLMDNQQDSRTLEAGE